MSNKLHVYLFGKDKNNNNVRIKREFDEQHKQQAIDELIQMKDRYSFGFIVTDKQRNDRMKLDSFYKEAKQNKGLTLFVEPTSLKQLQYCNVSLSYYTHKINK